MSAPPRAEVVPSKLAVVSSSDVVEGLVLSIQSRRTPKMKALEFEEKIREIDKYPIKVV